jgi:cyanophycinase-like exopeptidase
MPIRTNYSQPVLLKVETMNVYLLVTIFLVAPACLSGQGYLSYFTGDTADVQTPVKGGVVLMGGATESDAAMRWFLQQSGGGDVVVLRASGSNGYNDYLFGALGVSVNSVQTLVTTTAAGAQADYVARQIRDAEALWIAGGDQGKYVTFWKDGPIEEAIRYLIREKRAPVGGTSAGMAILGQAYFSALNGTITSEPAMQSPYSPLITLGFGDFIEHPDLGGVITDTHYDARDREGRHLTFMARLLVDYGILPLGIAAEEYTAVCIDSSGWARVFGSFPDEEDYAWFIQTNCSLSDPGPEVCDAASPLTWNRGNQALVVYQLPGDINGSGYFNIRDWRTTTGMGGTWHRWWVDAGVFHSLPGAEPDPCLTAVGSGGRGTPVRVFPNPAQDRLLVEGLEGGAPSVLTLTDWAGRKCRRWRVEAGQVAVSIQDLPPGCYFLHCLTFGERLVFPVIVREP